MTPQGPTAAGTAASHTAGLAPSAHVDTFCRDHLPATQQWPELIFDLPDVQYPARLNCAVELLDRTIAEYGTDRACLVAPDGTRWSYGELADQVRRVSRVLVDELAVVPGQRVLLRGPNNPWLVACWFAVLRCGAVAVTTMPLLRAGELSTIHEIAQLDLALCDDRFTDDLRAANLDVPVVTFGGTDPQDLVQRAQRHVGEHTAVDTAGDDVALLAFTSGTTGRPKATMHFHRDVLANADTFAKHLLKPTPEDVFTGTPPLAFTFGLGGLVVFPLRVGASTLLIEKASPDQLADLVESHGVTVCFTAPTAYRAMLTAGRLDRLSSLRRCVSAGEHLPAATWQAFYDATGIKIIDGLGATEMLHIFVSAADDDIRPGSTGRAVPGYQVTVLDADGNELPAGQVGRLAVRGPTGCRYLSDDRQAVYVQNGWNITGDTYLRDEDGYFWYQARSDDMIISAGYNIAAPEVEEALMSHPDVAEVAVIGMPDVDRGQLVTAFVVLNEDVVADPALVHALQDHVKAVIAPYKYPRRIEFVSELPRTSTGKLQRFRLRR
ncbi:AMP-binding protein [Angustibacter sp. McL0619]|uniref:AMP-binding protein n=1 Tax=Angustibacter sp. McL0619 TaxID=3415676 RepID=UPI003CEB8382